MRLATLVLAMFLYTAPALAGEVGEPVEECQNCMIMPAVPEPSAALLMGLGLLTVGAVTRRKNQ